MLGRQFTASVHEDDDKKAEIVIFDDIGEGFFTDGVTAQGINSQLKDFGDVDEIIVRINSPGGAVFDGLAIYNLLNQHKAKIIVEIDGLAASAASVIAMAGDTIRMAKNALMMVHAASGFVIGDADDMRETAEILDKITNNLIDIYTARSGRNRSDIEALVHNETWLTAEEALAEGLITDITEDKAIAAKATKWLRNHNRRLINQVIPFRLYPTSEKAWDGAAAKKRMQDKYTTDGELDFVAYRRGFTWFDEENPEVLGSYKLPHHDVEGGNLVTVRAGVIAAGNAVQGARGGVDIPADQLPGVRTHLGKHYAQFDLTPPWEDDDASNHQNPPVHVGRKQPQKHKTGDANMDLVKALGFADEAEVLSAFGEIKTFQNGVVSALGASSPADAVQRLTALIAKADKVTALEAEVTAATAKAEAEAINAQIKELDAEKKLAPAQHQMFRDMTAKQREQFIASAPTLVAGAVTPKHGDITAVTLTAEDLQVIELTGIDKAAFIKTRSEEGAIQ